MLAQNMRQMHTANSRRLPTQKPKAWSTTIKKPCGVPHTNSNGHACADCLSNPVNAKNRAVFCAKNRNGKGIGKEVIKLLSQYWKKDWPQLRH